MLTRLKLWLEETSTTQRQLALRMSELGCSITPGAISQFISGTSAPSIDTLKALSRATDLTTDELLFGGGSDSVVPRVHSHSPVVNGGER